MIRGEDGDFYLNCADFKRAGVGLDVTCGPSCRRFPLGGNVDPYDESPPEKIDPADGLPTYDQAWTGRRLRSTTCGAMASLVGDLPRGEWARVAREARKPRPRRPRAGHQLRLAVRV